MAVKKVALKNRIYGVGVELEGAWEKLPEGFHAHQIVYDGSVKFPNLYDINPNNHNLRPPRPRAVKMPDGTTVKPEVVEVYVGEIPSPVLTADNYGEWIRAHYPKYVNETCGMHTHTSFRSKLNYMRLMTPEFTNFVIKGLVGWSEEQKLHKTHPIWKRILTKNHNHCAHIYLGDNQVKVERKDFNSRGTAHSRYTAINYLWAYQMAKGYETGTVECRLLPMMETPEQAIAAVAEVLKLTNSFLAKMKEKEPRREAKVALAPPIESRYRLKI